MTDNVPIRAGGSARRCRIHAAYVAISRAREGATIYTDSRPKLTTALGIRDGSQVGAIDETLLRDDRAGIGIKTRSIGAALGL